MKISVKKTSVQSINALLLVVPVLTSANIKKKNEKKKDGKQWSDFHETSYKVLNQLDREFKGELKAQLKRFDFHPGPGKRINLYLTRKNKQALVTTALLSSLQITEGKKNPALDEWRKLGGVSYHTAKSLKAETVAIALNGLKEQELGAIFSAVTEGIYLAEYEYTAYKGNSKNNNALREIVFCVDTFKPSKTLPLIKQAKLTAEAVNLSRDLVNCPPSDLKPTELVQAARSLSRRVRGVKMQVFNPQQLKRMKAGALLGVGQGGDKGPFLIHLKLSSRARTKKTVVLIGKGITFDSGGLSIKPAGGMEDMKCDMAGAASLLGVLKALSDTELRKNLKHDLHLIIPTAENLVNEKSIKPGDVLKTMNGKTIEVLNTDAEGRLILADALAYSAKLEPDYIIDLATLTGACVVALGTDYAGLFCNDEEFSTLIEKNGEDAGENIWPLPLADCYRPLMDSNVAQIKNIGPGGPGAIIGALFLKEFVPQNVKWAHLDIAGPAFVKKGGEYHKAGGTGFGVRTLLRLLTQI